MPISHDHELILVHVPKNAGTSVQEAFAMGDMQGHHKPTDYEGRVPEAWESYTTLGISRNPFDRAVSAYEYAVQEQSYWHDAQNPGQAVHGKHPDYDRLNGKPFSYAVDHIGELQHHGWHKQVDYMCTGGEVAVDWVVKMENLDRGLSELCEAEGIEKSEIPSVNQSDREPDWVSYYDEDLASKVADYYAEDFEAFGYSKTLP